MRHAPRSTLDSNDFKKFGQQLPGPTQSGVGRTSFPGVHGHPSGAWKPVSLSSLQSLPASVGNFRNSFLLPVSLALVQLPSAAFLITLLAVPDAAAVAVTKYPEGSHKLPP